MVVNNAPRSSHADDAKGGKTPLARQALQRRVALMESKMEYESHSLDMKGVHGSKR